MNKFSFLLVILLWLEVSECFNPPFIFNRIKPGHCPTDTKLLGKDKTKGAICDSIRCDHDYDCRDDLLCCPSDCNARICIRPKKASSKSKLAYSTCPRFPNPSGVDQSVMCSTGANGLNLDNCRIGYLNDCPRTHRCCVYKCGGVCVHL